MKKKVDEIWDMMEHRPLPVPLLILLSLFVLGLWGCLAIYNATCYGPSPFYFVGRQLLWLVLSMIVLLVCSSIPFSFYRNNAELIVGIFYVPLLLVLIFGVQINGMTGWFAIDNVFIQPSELAKGAFILSLCHWGYKMEPGWPRFGGMLLLTLVWTLPVALQPDIGTAMVYIAGFIVMFWLIDGKLKCLLTIPAILLPICAGLLYSSTYLMNRVLGFLNPESDPLGIGWHVRQFQFTLARGGLWGTKWGKALWANSYLPLSHSDSVYASLSEALGFAGALPVVILMALLVFFAYRLTLKVKDEFRKSIILGVAMLFAIQALIHVSVNVTLMPVTGITMPVLSYGGSSLLATMAAFGVLLSAAGEEKNIFAAGIYYQRADQLKR